MNGQAFHNQNTHLLGKAAAFGLLLSLLFWGVACEKEVADVEVPEPEYATLVISLGSMDNAIPITRASEEEFPYERKIEKCWVVLFDSNNDWFMTVTTDKFTIDNNDIDSRSEATVEVPLGTYTGYAFANLHNLDNGTALTDALEKGQQLDRTDLTMAYLNNLSVSLGTDASVFKVTDGGKAIPMSSYAKENITVRENVTNSVEIGMFRMLGKVTITVTNQLRNGTMLSLKNLSMEYFRKGNILFIPYKQGEITLDDMLNSSAQHELQPKFPDDSGSTEKYTQTVVDKDDSPVSISNGDSEDFSFYAFETGTETNLQNNGDMQVQIQVNDRALSTKNTDFSFMRRNDWLKIPIYVSDIETSLWFENMRMPIGGLPYQVKYGDTDGIQILVDAVNEVDPDYAGPVKIEIEVQSINTRITNPTILYTNTTATGSERSTAILVDNTDNLLIDAETGEPRDENYDFTVYPSPDAPDATNKAYFEVWTQELANESDATIQLTLIAEYGDTEPKSRIEIPYTIRIQNYKRTTDGGN